MPSHPQQSPSPLTLNSETGEWDFESFIVWLKAQKVFEAFDENHPFGPSPKNLEMVGVTNSERFKIDKQVFRLPGFPGDAVSNWLKDSLSNEHLISTKLLPWGGGSESFRALVFASYSGMLEKVLNPVVMKPYLEHRMLSPKIIRDSVLEKKHTDWLDYLIIDDDEDLTKSEFRLTNVRDVKAVSEKEGSAIHQALKKNPAMGMAVLQYSDAIKEFVISLKAAIKSSPSLDADEKKRGNTLCETIAVNANFYENPLVSSNPITTIGLAYVVNHETYKPENEGKNPRPTRKDFQAGMEFLRANEWFKLGKTRCPAEAAVLKLSGIATGVAENGKHATTFGNLVFHCYEATQKELDGQAEIRTHAERLRRTGFGIG